MRNPESVKSARYGDGIRFFAVLGGMEYQAMLGRFPLVLPIATRWKLSARGCALRATLGENTERSQPGKQRFLGGR